MAARPTNYTAGRTPSSQRDEGDFKLRELMQANKRAPPTPTPPNGSRKDSSPDSALFPPEPPLLAGLRRAASKTTKNRRRFSGPWKTHDYSLQTAGISLPLADPRRWGHSSQLNATSISEAHPHPKPDMGSPSGPQISLRIMAERDWQSRMGDRSRIAIILESCCLF